MLPNSRLSGRLEPPRSASPQNGSSNPSASLLATGRELDRRSSSSSSAAPSSTRRELCELLARSSPLDRLAENNGPLPLYRLGILGERETDRRLGVNSGDPNRSSSLELVSDPPLRFGVFGVLGVFGVDGSGTSSGARPRNGAEDVEIVERDMSGDEKIARSELSAIKGLGGVRGLVSGGTMSLFALLAVPRTTGELRAVVPGVVLGIVTGAGSLDAKVAVFDFVRVLCLSRSLLRCLLFSCSKSLFACSASSCARTCSARRGCVAVVVRAHVGTTYGLRFGLDGDGAFSPAPRSTPLPLLFGECPEDEVLVVALLPVVPSGPAMSAPLVKVRFRSRSFSSMIWLNVRFLFIPLPSGPTFWLEDDDGDDEHSYSRSFGIGMAGW